MTLNLLFSPVVIAPSGPGLSGAHATEIAGLAKEMRSLGREGRKSPLSKATRGVTLLFSGPSGTGKTLAAQTLARKIGMPLWRVNPAAVSGKNIGEIEKNLASCFAQATVSGAILLFDEADAIFGKRSEVKFSHDRYANIEVSYLLQSVENFGGLAILTTNQRNSIDGAVLRRFDRVLDFMDG